MMKLFTTAYFLLASFSLRADCWKEVSAGDYYSLGIQTNGTLWAWGMNKGNAIFADSTRYGGSDFPFRISPDSNWRTVSAGADHVLAIRTDGTLWAWGRNYSGEIGNGTFSSISVKVPTRIGSDTDWAAVSAGDNHSVALKSNGSLWTWGDNAFGALGDSTQVSKNVPTQVAATMSWKYISAGDNYTMAIQSNGSLWGWGYNNGLLGDGQASHRIAPIRIGLDSNWRLVDAGSIHTMAIKTDSSLWATGSVLGNGMSFTRSIVPVDTVHNWHSVTISQDYTVALKVDSTLWAWGRTFTSKPAQIGTASNWSSVSARDDHTLATTADHSAWAFGANFEGQLGDSTTTNRSAPVIISSCVAAPLAVQGAVRSREDFTIYPNPVQTLLHVRSPSQEPVSRIEIMDFSGRVVAAPMISRDAIQTEHLAPGMYLLQIQSGDDRHIYRFVRE